MEKRSASSASSADDIGAFFSDPPDWLRRQVEKHLENPAERTMKPLCMAIATTLYNDPWRGGQIRLEVERELGRWSK